jgi:hypothetical protein
MSQSVDKKSAGSSRQVHSKQDLLLITLRDFFHDKKRLNKMLKILKGESDISLRILDWFTTNYSKKYNISYDKTNNHGHTQKFIVYLDYKSQLKAYSKKEFDPFCRRERILFEEKDGTEFPTTVGQLNFFRWAIENQILEYVEDHFQDISKDMNQSMHHLYKKNKKKDSSKEKESITTNSSSGGASSSTPTDVLSIEETKEIKKKEKEAKRNKRKELSISATKTINKHNVKITIQFE